MFKDFNYAAWLFVKGYISIVENVLKEDTDPYRARKAYIQLADELLENIPGPHLVEMKKWPKWDGKKSPPVPGGKYTNPKWIPAGRPSSAPNSPQVGPSKAPEKVSKPPTDDIKNPVPQISQEDVLPKIEPAQPGSASPAVPAAIEPPPVIEKPVEILEAAEVPAMQLQPASPPADSNAPSLLLPPPIPVAEDTVSIAASSDDALEGIAGLRPANIDPEARSSAIVSPEGMVKHVALLGGKIPSQIKLTNRDWCGDWSCGGTWHDCVASVECLAL